MAQSKRKGVGTALERAAKTKDDETPAPPDTSSDHQRTINLPADLWRELDDAAMRRKYRRIAENKERERGSKVSTRASASEIIREILLRHREEIGESE